MLITHLTNGNLKIRMTISISLAQISYKWHAKLLMVCAKSDLIYLVNCINDVLLDWPLYRMSYTLYKRTVSEEGSHSPD